MRKLPELNESADGIDTVGRRVSRRQLLSSSGAAFATALFAGCGRNGDNPYDISELKAESRTALIDPENVDFWVLRKMSEARLREQNRRAKEEEMMMVDIGFDEAAGKFHAIWQENVWHVDLPEGYDWNADWDLSRDEFDQANEDAREDGYRLLHQEHYVRDRKRQYAGIWIENEGDLEWESVIDLTHQEYGDEFDKLADGTRLPISIQAYEVDGTTYYSSVWVENTAELEWSQLRNMSPEAYGEQFDEWMNGGYRIIDLVSYRRNGTQNFAAIAVENTERNAFQGRQRGPDDHGGRAWGAYRNMTDVGYANKFREMVDKGYRPISMCIYETDSGTRRAAVWRQNAMRQTWEKRADVDELLTDHVGMKSDSPDRRPVPSLSAAIIKDGVWLYRRGFGISDEETYREAHSGTIYRLASVSKAVTGVLAARLYEAGEIDFDAETRTYLSDELDADHEHTLAHLLAHQACVPHYSETFSLWSPTGQYDTASGAAAWFDHWNDSLLEEVVSDEDDAGPSTNTVHEDDITLADGTSECSAGKAYRYSTHGYTLLGAALEAATNTAAPDLIREELSEPYGLQSLRAEDRDAAESDRARLYEWETPDSNNWDGSGPSGWNTVIDESEVSNISWKLLGGGMEASTYDLARLGWLLLDDELLEADTRDDELWEAVDEDLKRYGLGWHVGTHEINWEFYDVMYHGGKQTGGNSAIRVYPDEDLVVAVLANRERSHDWIDQMERFAKNLAEIALS